MLKLTLVQSSTFNEVNCKNYKFHDVIKTQDFATQILLMNVDQAVNFGIFLQQGD